MVLYVDAVVAVTVMHVLLFVLYVCMPRKGDGNAGVRDGGGVVVVSAWHEYVGGTRGLDIVSSTVDVLGMRGVGRVC